MLIQFADMYEHIRFIDKLQFVSLVIGWFDLN